MNTSPALSLRGFMVCYHQMHDFTPWFGPNRAALSTILDAMAASRLNALLVEYETYFPWSGAHARIRAKDHLTDEEVLSFNAEAAAKGIEIIPLVQVLGHTYHILIHPEYANCAEDKDFRQQLCPLSPDTLKLAKELIDDTLRLHPGCRHLHIGGDECRMLGHCPRCADYARIHGLGKLFADYMSKIADYVLSKGVTPILWHDIAINHPECLGDFDNRVIFNYWHYGTASHGDSRKDFETLLKYIPAERIIGSPGARAEMGNGALHHFPSLQETNILDVNKLIANAGGLGTILTDWPDTGCPFLDSFHAMRAQAEASWNGGASLRDFRRNYAAKVFGCNEPGLIDMLDAIAGSTVSAWGFQHRQGDSLDRYARLPYDFKRLCKVIRESYQSGAGLGELYRQVGQLGAIANLKETLQAMLATCSRNRQELHWHLLQAEVCELFLTIDVALRKECFVYAAFSTPTAEQIQRFESRSYAQRALDNWDDVQKHFKEFHGSLTAQAPLDAYCRELFSDALRKGLQDFILNGFRD